MMTQRPTDEQHADTPAWTGTRTGTATAAGTTPPSEAPTSTADLLGRTSERESTPQVGDGPKYVAGEETPTSSTDSTAMRADGGAEMTTPRPAASASAAADTTTEETATPLLAEAEAGAYQSRWQEIQSRFVDDPRQAVEQGDQLVAQVIQHLAEVFAQERGKLEEQWSGGGEADTEDLRVALRRYRSFFERLLSA